jgi:squalene-hopene/tetraprenyl-beta-curcumene cyclase
MNLDEIIKKAKAYVWSTQKDDSYWLYAPYLGPSFISQYYLVLNHLDLLDRSKIDINKLKEILLQTVQNDGGWQQVPDPSRQSNLDATIFNYWFLKSSQVLTEKEETIISNARKFILRSGGLDACSHMTKIWLCLFSQYDWKKIAYIPLSVFRDDNMLFKCTFVKSWVAQWVYPHVLPIAYLRYFSLNKNLGDRFNLSELNLEEVSISNNESSKYDSPCFEILNIIKKLADMRRPLASYGAYTVSTLFSMMALKHFAQTFPNHIELEKLHAELNQSFDFVDDIYFNSDSSSYLGVLDDGRWWDTLLITWGLLECDENSDKLKPVIRHMFDQGVQKNGEKSR